MKRSPTAARLSKPVRRGVRPRAEANPDFPPGSLEARIAKLGRRIPKSEWDRLPADLSSNLDHYLYGIPKRR